MHPVTPNECKDINELTACSWMPPAVRERITAYNAEFRKAVTLNTTLVVRTQTATFRQGKEPPGTQSVADAQREIARAELAARLILRELLPAVETARNAQQAKGDAEVQGELAKVAAELIGLGWHQNHATRAAEHHQDVQAARARLGEAMSCHLPKDHKTRVTHLQGLLGV